MKIKLLFICLIVFAANVVYAEGFDHKLIKREWLYGKDQERKVFDEILDKEVDITLELENLKNIPAFPEDFLKGKFTVIDIWATWCGPCLASIPENNEIYSEFKDKINFVGICVPKESYDFEQIVRKKEIKYPVGIDKDSDIIKYFRALGFPTYHLISPDGRLVVADIKASNLRDVLNVVLNNGMVN